MGEQNLNIRIKHKYDTEANWNKNNPVLLSGEIAITSDKFGKHKVGDGTHKWSELSYAKAELTKGDVTGALGYTPPSSDTWRGIQDNLISSSTTESLSAAQGKILKELVDGKAPSSHTHTKSEVGLGNVDNTADATKVLNMLFLQVAHHLPLLLLLMLDHQLSQYISQVVNQ